MAQRKGVAVRSERARAALLAGIGFAALAIGVLAYLTDRSTTHAMLLPHVPALAGMRIFGTVGQWLPSLVHVFAFSLFTAAALPAGARNAVRACAGWFVVDMAFEIGQHPRISGPLGQALLDLLGQGPMARALAGYFVRGTFDPGDIAAAAAGALAAAWVLFSVRFTSKAPDEK